MPRRGNSNLTKEARRKRNAKRAAANRAKETPEQREKRLEKNRVRVAAKRSELSFIGKRIKNFELAKIRASQRANETPQQKLYRLEKDRIRRALERERETPEQKQKRLEKGRERQALRRAMETPEEKEERLKKSRVYIAKKRQLSQPERQEALKNKIQESLNKVKDAEQITITQSTGVPIKAKRKLLSYNKQFTRNNLSFCAMMPFLQQQPLCFDPSAINNSGIIPHIPSGMMQAYPLFLSTSCALPMNNQILPHNNIDHKDLSGVSKNVKCDFSPIESPVEIITPDEVDPVKVVCEVDVIDNSITLNDQIS